MNFIFIDQARFSADTETVVNGIKSEIKSRCPEEKAELYFTGYGLLEHLARMAVNELRLEGVTNIETVGVITQRSNEECKKSLEWTDRIKDLNVPPFMNGEMAFAFERMLMGMAADVVFCVVGKYSKLSELIRQWEVECKVVINYCDPSLDAAPAPTDYPK